nr:SDR family oxidoreductase [Sphingomonas sp. CDS-1]
MILPRTPGFDLSGRRAVVTGAGRGLGLACAAALAGAGAHVTLVARTGSEVTQAALALAEAGGQAEGHALDILDQDGVARFFGERPAFDILVNNAGTNRPKPFRDVSQDDYDAVLGLNLRAAFFVAQACARALLDAGRGGTLIHIGSQMGHVGAENRSLYCASKWALEGLNKALAVELGPHGIRSNVIAPTFIETPMTKPFLADEGFRASVLSKIKLGRLGTVEDVMGAVVFLASDAAALVTGTSLLVDGGWTAD